MPIALGNHTKGRSAGSSVTGDAAINTPAGSTNYVVVVFDPSASVSGAITDVAGNTYTQADITRAAPSTGQKIAIYLKQNAAGSASNNVTVNFSVAAFPSLFFGAITGVPASSLDVQTGGTAASATIGVATGTLAQAAELVLMAVTTDGGGTVTYSESGGPTLTSIDQEQDGANYWTGAIFYKVVSATTTTTPTVVASAGGASAAVLVTLMEGAGGGGGSGNALDESGWSSNLEAQSNPLIISIW